jgi:hypothetical protein
MTTFKISRVAPIVAFLTMATFVPSVAASASPKSAAPSRSFVKIQAAPRVPDGTRATGSLPSSARVNATVVLQPRDEAGLTDFIAGVTNSHSALYHQYLAPGAFAGRFGATPATIAAVKAELAAEGLHVTSVASDGLLVNFSGSAATVESAFRTGIESYRLSTGATGRGTTSAVQVPATIARSVAGVVGLDDLVQSQPADVEPGGTAEQHSFPAAKTAKFSHPAGSPTPCTAATDDALSQGGLTDDQIAHAYGAFGLYRAGDFGLGQHIGVFELQPFLATDIETFDSCFFGPTEAAAMSGTDGNLTGSRLSVTPVDGGELQPGPGSENDEATLDIEDVSALAPEADIDVYEAPNSTFGLIDQYAQIVDSDIDQTVTSSWAECEQLTQVAEPGIQQAENFLFEQAAAQGQTVLSAAGDTGNDECNSDRLVEPPAGQNLLSLLDPASQPYVVSVGGTTITDATEPPAEQVWNDGASWGGGGGGISESWAMPSWQQPVANTPANSTDITNAESFETANAAYSAPFTTPTFCDGTQSLPAGTLCREAPDVSAQADEFTGAVTLFGVSLGYGPPNGWATIGGTSSSTPIWAALLALVNASSSCSGSTVNGVQDVGFVSPLLYGIASNPTAYARSFNDVVSGNNDDYGLDDGLVFPARTGYDMASGLGSPQLTTPSGGHGLAFYLCDYAGKLKPPVVTGLSPSSGPTAAGDTVTVSGSGFGTAGKPKVAGVEVGSSKATSFQVVNATTLTVTFPAAVATTPPNSPNPTLDGAGPAEVVVTSTTGQSSAASAASIFEFVDEGSAGAIPSVTGVSPFGGPQAVTANVTVFGSDFGTCPTGTAGASCPGNVASDVTAVDFGGVAGSAVHVVSPFELTVTPPPFASLTPSKSCVNAAVVSPTTDICQVQVTVTTTTGTSGTATILPPYEGALNYDSMGGLILPPDCGCEDEQAPTEFDYDPAPTVTSVSTGSPADLPANAAQLASEFGGAPSNLVTVDGTGMDILTFAYITLTLPGSPPNENAIDFPVALTGTSMELVAPALIPPTGTPSVEPFEIAVGFTSMAGPSTEGEITYAGVPTVSSALTGAGIDGAPDTGGTPITITGAGFEQAVGPIGFIDNVSSFSVGTQYVYTVDSDTSISTETVAQNPAAVDVEVCTVTGCSYNPPADIFLLYPPGNPKVVSISPKSGSAAGGTVVTISGQNLGCVTGVFFGTVAATTFSNVEALLDCGSTSQVLVIAPPGTVGTKVPVTVTTVESDLTGSGPSTSSASFTYKRK